MKETQTLYILEREVQPQSGEKDWCTVSTFIEQPNQAAINHILEFGYLPKDSTSNWRVIEKITTIEYKIVDQSSN